VPLAAELGEPSPLAHDPLLLSMPMKLHLRSARLWRWLTGLLLAAVAGIHITLVPDHLREAPYAGWLFLGLSAAAGRR
jgi:hypothetical protein